jgi:hypothetical protein
MGRNRVIASRATSLATPQLLPPGILHKPTLPAPGGSWASEHTQPPHSRRSREAGFDLGIMPPAP